MDDAQPTVDCVEVVKEIYTFLDGELTDAQRAVIQYHLRDCSPCLEAFDFEAELRQFVSTRCREQPPEGLRLRISAAIDLEARRGLGGPGIPTL